MSSISTGPRLTWLMAAALLACPIAAADDSPSVPSVAGGRAQQRAIQHTKDPLAAIRKRVDDKTAVMIDVRSKEEWDAGHLRHALFLPISKLKLGSQDPDVQKVLSKLALDREKIIYCHCKAGVRALQAAPILKSLGLDVRPMAAGYDELLEAGFEKAPPTSENSAADSSNK